MEDSEIRLGNRQLLEGFVQRAWAEGQLGVATALAVGGALATTIITWMAYHKEILDAEVSLRDELIYIVIAVTGGLIALLVYFTYLLARAPFRQRDEARDELRKYMTDDASIVIASLDEVQIRDDGLTAADGLLYMESDLRNGARRGTQNDDVLTNALKANSNSGCDRAFLDTGVIAVDDQARWRPYKLTPLGEQACMRMKKLGRVKPSQPPA